MKKLIPMALIALLSFIAFPGTGQTSIKDSTAQTITWKDTTQMVPVTYKIKTVTIDHYRTITITKVDSIKSTPEFKNIRGIYFDHPSVRLGTSDIPEFIKGVDRDKFNYVGMYDTHITLADPNSSLAKLQGDLNAQLRDHGVIWITGVYESDYSKIIAFNKLQTDPKRCFNVLNKEKEYWNNTADPVGAFNQNKTEVIAAFGEVGKNGILRSEQYNGHFLGSLASLAPQLIANYESNILLHCYTDKPTTNYVSYRWDSLNAINKRKGTIQPALILPSAEAAFFGPELATWGPDSIMNVQKRVITTGKNYSNLDFVGWVWFDWQYYKLYRPVPASFSLARTLMRKSNLPEPPPTLPEHLKIAEFLNQ